jgi:hypothetical protein
MTGSGVTNILSCFSLNPSLCDVANPYCPKLVTGLLSYFSMNKALPIYRKIYVYYFKSNLLNKTKSPIVFKHVLFKNNPNPSQISCKTNFSTKSARTNLAGHALRLAQPSLHLAQEAVALSKNSFATAPIAGGRTDPDFPN